jgi:hypothetical protein
MNCVLSLAGFWSHYETGSKQRGFGNMLPFKIENYNFYRKNIINYFVNERQMGKDVEGTSRGLFEGATLILACMD